jgi:hypothetical protein
LTHFEDYKPTSIKLSASTIAFILLVGMLGVVVLATPPAGASGKFKFSSYEIARSGNSTVSGVACPNRGTNCWNYNGEPNIATAPDGSIYVSSENTAFNHPSECQDPTGGTVSQLLYICGGTGAWKSSDSGAHFTSLTSPNTNYDTGYATTLWGGDTHVATAIARNANGYYNVYVVSLEAAGAGLVGVGLSTSQDGGATWSNNPFAIQFTNPISMPLVEDRPWVAAYGPSEVCVSAHELVVLPDVYCSFDAGLSFGQASTALDANHAWLAAEINIPGALHIDPNSGIIYLPFAGVANSTEAAIDAPCGLVTACPYQFHTMWMAVSTDGGLTFTDYQVYNNPDTLVNYGSQFPAMTVDSSGNAYVTYSNGVSLFYSYSTDRGQTWHGPYQVNQAPSSWAIEPWIAAGAEGKIDIVWYGSGNCGTGVTDADNCQQSATWNVYFAQNQNVLADPTAFSQTAATGVVHEGPVCLNGSGCQSYRGLFDDFGITTDPMSGLATIVYNNDMYTPGNPSNLPNPDCTSQYTTSTDPAQQNCVHTDIAHQTAGPGVIPKHAFQIKHQSLTEQDGGTSFGYQLSVQNTGNTSITSLAVSLAGLSIPLSLNSSLPLMPAATISGDSTVSPQSILLVVGDVYPVAVTATFADGSTLTQTTTVGCTIV